LPGASAQAEPWKVPALALYAAQIASGVVIGLGFTVHAVAAVMAGRPRRE
jgi:hypothetical protein